MIKNKEGITFGAVDMVVTLLGVIIGLSFSGDRNIILTGILVTGIADSFANASGIYAMSHVENGESNIYPAIYCFMATFGTMILMVVPFLAYSLSQAVYISATISLILLVLFGYYAVPKSTSKPYLVPLRFLIVGVSVGIICYVIGSVII